MNAANARIISAFGLLCVFALALALRLYGIDWAFKDGVYTPHPDERHYQSCADVIQLKALTEEERALPFWQQARIWAEKNLIDQRGIPLNQTNHPQKPGLRPVNYNYGTLPIYLYLIYRHYIASNSGGAGEWPFLAFFDWLSLILIAFTFVIGLRLFLAIRRDFIHTEPDKKPWYEDTRPLVFFFPAMIMPFVGLMLMVFFPTSLNDFSSYNPQTASILLTGRIVTAWAGSLTILLAYLIGRDAFNRWVGLIAAVFLTTAMLHIQSSHFATVDVLVGFWATLAVYAFLKVAQNARLRWYLLGAAASGFAVATKWSGITLPGILLIAHAAATWGRAEHGRAGRWINTVWMLLLSFVTLHFFQAASSLDPMLHVALAEFRDFYWNWLALWLLLIAVLFFASVMLLRWRSLFHGGAVGWLSPLLHLYKPWLWLLLAIPTGVLAFAVGEPMAFFDAPHFAANITEQAQMHVTGERPIIFTKQFNHTPGLVYLIDNLFYPSLDWFTAFWVIGGCIYILARLIRRPRREELLLAAWVIPSFVLYGTFHSKFPRYLDSILPVMMVFGARLLWDTACLAHHQATNPTWLSLASHRVLARAGAALGAFAIVCGLIYGFAYIGIYNEPHTLVQTRNWLNQNAPQGSRITQNTWDEGFGIHIERDRQIRIHDWANEAQNPEERARYFAETLQFNDYIVFPSKRGYGTTLQNLKEYPVTNKFLKALFAEHLGYRVAKVITNPPRFLWWEFRVDEEDETARIYDHPKVVIFVKHKEFETSHYIDLILDPPDWIRSITESDILRQQHGRPVYFHPPQAPVVSWWVFIQLLGWLAFLILFPLGLSLPDRGYGISKIVGIALFAWLVWIAASARIVPLSTGLMLGVFLLLLGLAVISAWYNRSALADYLKSHWRLLLGLEILLIGLWVVFLIIKIYHPSATWGEKPMNIAFLNAVYRTQFFPPEDPWISNYPINYYYYGHAIFALAGRFIGIPVEYMFNIAGPYITALTGLGIFTLAYALCRRVFVSLLAVYLCVFAGHIMSYSVLLRHELNRVGIGLYEFFAGAGAALTMMFQALSVYFGFAGEATLAQVQRWDYNRAFWAAGHDLIFGTAANEFPYWTHLFMDFHAHLLVMPFVFAYLVLLYAFFAREFKQAGNGEWFGMLFLLALLLGTVTCVNTWDLPACLFALLFAVGVKFWRESELVHSKFRAEWLSPPGLTSFAKLPLLPLAAVPIASYVMMYPFHFHFVSRVSSVRFMTEGQTPVFTYLGLWGHLLLPVIAGIVLFFVLRRDGGLSIIRFIAATAIFLVILGAANFVTLINQSEGWREFFTNFWLIGPVFEALHYATRHPGWQQQLGPPLDYRTAGLFIPFLVLLFITLWQRWRNPGFAFACLIGVLGLGLSMGIEFFYVKEIWSEPSHRYNTVFKFNLQVWHYLSIFAALSLLYVWRQLRQLGETIGLWFTLSSRALFALAVFVLLLPTLPFTITGPALVTLTGGAKYRDAKGEIPNLDGLTFYQQEKRELYNAIQWFNRFEKGTPTIVELSDRAYFGQNPIATYTGLPAVLGWPHHVSERVHFANEHGPRLNAVRTIYTSDDREQVLRLLGKYNVEYVFFGELEMNEPRGHDSNLPPFGEGSLNRFEQWADLFHLYYRTGDTSIFTVQDSLNRAFGLSPAQVEPQPEQPPALRSYPAGVSMFESSRGQANGQFNEPRGLTVAPDGTVFVADSFNHRLQVFHPDGTFLWKLARWPQSNRSEINRFNEPNDITVDFNTGNVYIADTWNSRVVLMNRLGEILGSTIDQKFYGPRGIVFHNQLRMLYLTDTGHHQLVMMTPEGEVVKRIGRIGDDDDEFNEPVGIDVMPNGDVIVVDTKNRRLKVYSPQGDLRHIWPIPSESDSLSESHVACSDQGPIYVTHPAEGAVYVLSSEGDLTRKIRVDLEGRPLVKPVGIAWSPQNQVLVSDLAQNRIVRVR